MKARILISVGLTVALLLVAGAMASFLVRSRGAPARRQVERPAPLVVAPRLSAISDYGVRLVGYGSVRARTQLQIVPLVSGEVIQRAGDFFSGRYVLKDQELFRIDPTDYQLARDVAQQSVRTLVAQTQRLDREEQNLLATRDLEQERTALAQRELERTRTLLQRGAAGESEADQAEQAALGRRISLHLIRNELSLIPTRRAQLAAERASAEARLRQAETDLKRTTYLSPVTGRVIRCTLETGEYVQAGVACGELYGIEAMEIPVSVPASDLEWIDPRHLATCQFCAGLRDSSETESHGGIRVDVEWDSPGGNGGKRPMWEGCVDRIEAGLQAQTRTATLVVRVDNPSPQQASQTGTRMLDINMFIRATIHGKTIPRAFILPRSAVQDDGTVYVVDEGTLQVREVQVARFTDDQAMLLPGSGIREGDRVVLNYIPKPVVGMHVRIAGEDVPAATTEPGPSRGG
jgi:multidrug efflux pump subunit AcrA (membrane-fusion protein)